MRTEDLALTSFLAYCMRNSAYSNNFSARIRKMSPGSEERFLFRGRFTLHDMHIKHEKSGLSVWSDELRSSKAEIFGIFRLSRSGERDHVLRIQHYFNSARFDGDYDGSTIIGFFSSQQDRVDIDHNPNDQRYSFMLDSTLAASFVK